MDASHLVHGSIFNTCRDCFQFVSPFIAELKYNDLKFELQIFWLLIFFFFNSYFSLPPPEVLLQGYFRKDGMWLTVKRS